MDKNKSRTDLLAAGRKKLQQFRQKKDGKGSSSQGKSSKKSDKSELHDANTAAVSEESGLKGLSHALGEEMQQQLDSNPVNADSNDLTSRDNTVPTDTGGSTVDSSCGPISSAPEVHDLHMNSELSAEGLGGLPVGLSVSVDEELMPDSPSLKESEGSVPDDPEAKGIASPVISEMVMSKEVTCLDKLETVELHPPMETQIDMPELPLISMRQDQGAKCSVSEQFLRGSEMEPEVEGNHPKSEHREVAESLSGTVLSEITMEQSICEADGEHFVVTESAVAGDEPEWISVSPVVTSDTGRFPDVDHEGLQMTNEANLRPSNEERSQTAVQENSVEQIVDGSEMHPQVEESTLGDKSFLMSLENKMVSLSGDWPSNPGTDVRVIRLVHLAELLKGLDESDFKFLLKSRDSAWLEQSKLQLDFDQEKHQQDNEVSMLAVSLNKTRDRNQRLSDELVHCQSELLTVISEKNGLQVQVYSAKAEIEGLSSLVSDLQNKLERYQEDFASLSGQLTDLKSMVHALESEKASLSGSISSIAEERQKLEEEKEHFLHENEKLSSEMFKTKSLLESLQWENSGLSESLAAVTIERNMLEGEKDVLVRENERLSINMSELHLLIGTVQVDNASARETVALLTEEKRKLECEKDHSVLENDKLISELAKCNGLLDAANLETAKLGGHLASMTMERNKLEEEKSNVICMNEKFSSELRALEELLSVSRTEKLQLELDLKEVNLHSHQITEENMYLKNNLEKHKMKIQEISARNIQGIGKQVGEDFTLELKKPLTDGTAVRQLPGCVFDECSEFVPFKENLEEALKITQRFEKAIEHMRTYSESLCQQGGKGAGAGVSKLIQAFETKAQADSPAMEEVLDDGISAKDPFILANEETEKLREVLKQLVLHAGSAVNLFKEERDGRNLAQAAFQDVNGQYKVMREHADILEAMNIELEVQTETFKQHVHFVESKCRDFKALYGLLQQKEITLTAENETLIKKLSESLPRVIDLQYQLQRMRGTSDEMASSVSCLIQDLQNVAAEKASLFKHEWESFVGHISETIGKLNASSSSFFEAEALISTNSQSDLDVAARIAFSVDTAVNVMEKLQGELEASRSELNMVNNLLRGAEENFTLLHENYEVTVGILRKIYDGLREIIILSRHHENESEAIIETEEPQDVLHFSIFENIMVRLGELVSERVQLISENKQLSLDVISKTQDVEVLNRRCCDIDSILNSVKDAVKKELEIDHNKPHLSQLEYCISFLLQRYKNADGQISISKEEFQARDVEFNQMQEQIGRLNSLNFHQETEIISLKESLGKAEVALANVHSELQNKASELEQSEQRVSSIREKLSIAVAKGKGLISQRDNLKQSLVEKSNELERCYQELQLKDGQLVEIEAKLKTYSEAGERVEALESELSYIRNSATALRESFLLKDSVLQRVEEILEDLELPEDFHSRDTIEKVDWLARSVARNPLPPADWDHKSSVDGGSHSDSGFVVMDGWKEEAQSTCTDDLRKQYEDLQNKFYGLAEQNEMLEQSLMERNNVIQKWEEILDKVNIPSQLRSMEPESRIEWMATAVSDAQLNANSLKEKIGHLEGYCGKLAADLEESERRLSDVQGVLQSVADEKDGLYNDLVRISSDHAKVSEKTINLEMEKEALENEINRLREELQENFKGAEENIHLTENRIRRLQDLVTDALQDPTLNDLVSLDGRFDCLEDLLRRLIDNYSSLSLSWDALGNPITERVDKSSVESGTDALLSAQMAETATAKKELEVCLSELEYMKEERDAYVEKHQSLVGQVEALHKRVEELQELLTQEEQKSSSLREKLNVAVRKGKSLVQQRDSLKQTIEDMNIKVESLSSEIRQHKTILAEYEQKFKDFSTYPERLAALESENLFLRNGLTEANHYSQEKDQTLSMILSALQDIDVPGEFAIDPIKKLQQLGNLCRDLHAAVDLANQESKKSKRAAELLLAELNEVQERNDHLQDELVRASNDLFELSNSKEIAEASKLEAFAHLDKASVIHAEERKKQFDELMELKCVLDDLKEGLLHVSDILDKVLYMDSQFIENLVPAVQSCLEPSDSRNMLGRSLVTSGGIENKESILVKDIKLDSKTPEHFDNNVIEVWNYIGDCLQEYTAKIHGMKEKLQKHVAFLHEEDANIAAVVEHVHTEMTSRTKSMEKEKGMENDALRKIITLLSEACFKSIMEIENWKAHMLGNSWVMTDGEMNFRSVASYGRGEREMISFEEHIRKLADRLLTVVKDVNGMEYDYLQKSQNEMKTTIASLQTELQEKDVQRERICLELVSQIKEAEASAAIYSRDLQSARSQIRDLEKQVEMIKQEKDIAGQKVNELLTAEATSLELQARVGSLSDLLAAKDQEIESLMQALDEEETQMDDLNKKVEVLEKALHQKNLDLENIEASRGKAVKKLSITVSKFDELHNLSESLLGEVENLQTQLHERDAEVSFLRQEVTRCTNDILAASQMSNKRNSEEIFELFTWLATMMSRVNVGEVHLDDLEDDQHQVDKHKHKIEKQITSMISELEDLRAVAQSKDALLLAERSRVEELKRKEEVLEESLHQKEAQLTWLHDARNSGQARSSVQSEILEAEPLINKWPAPGTSSSSQVRSLRKGNNDQVVIAVDDPSTSNMLEDEDDDKVHGFKSLTTSRIVPRFTRPVSNMIDGLWVSCDRALMRQPALRLGIIIYWAILHALLATFVV